MKIKIRCFKVLLWNTKEMMTTPLKFVVYKCSTLDGNLCTISVTWDQTNLVLNSIEKVKPGFLFSLMSMFHELNGTKFQFHSFQRQRSGIFLTKIDQKGDSMKMSFDNFQIQKWKSKTVRAQKVNEKMGSYV